MRENRRDSQDHWGTSGALLAMVTSVCDADKMKGSMSGGTTSPLVAMWGILRVVPMATVAAGPRPSSRIRRYSSTPPCLTSSRSHCSLSVYTDVFALSHDELPLIDAALQRVSGARLWWVGQFETFQGRGGRDLCQYACAARARVETRFNFAVRYRIPRRFQRRGICARSINSL
jgi:hypothetical protein